MAVIAKSSICAASLLALHVESRLISAQPSPSFASFVSEHGRAYVNSSAEFEMRKGLYEQRVADYAQHNSNPNRLWTAKVNSLTDWTEEELKSLRGWSGNDAGEGAGAAGLRGSRPVARHSVGLGQENKWWGSSLLHSAEEEIVKDAAEITVFSKSSKGAGDADADIYSQSADWLHLDSAQTVQQQGGCGSCWAYATKLAMETNYEIKRGTARTFSATQLVHCAPNPQHCGGPGGCGGSTAEMAMAYVMHNGLGSADECPEISQSPSSQDPRLILPGTHDVPEGSPARELGLVSWERLPENEAAPLMRALLEVGPAAVSVSADHWGGYGGGVLDACPPDVVIDHAVVLLAFGHDAELGVDYWTLRNSWGAGWGEDGGIRLLRTSSDDSFCGVDSKPERGTGCTGGPSSVTVCGMCGILYDTMVPHFSQ